MYTKISVYRDKVKIVRMARLNINSTSNKKKNKVNKDYNIEKDKRYSYNQLKKRREIIGLININFETYKSSFITLTFGKDGQDVKWTSTQFGKLMATMRRLYKDFKYIATVELQEIGNIHYHVICNVEDNEQLEKVILKYWKHGTVSVKQVNEKEGLSKYMTKDFLKQDKNSILFGQRCYKRSNNLKEPIISKSWTNEIKEIESLIGEHIYTKKITDEGIGKIIYEDYKLNLDHKEIFGEYVKAKRK